MPHLIAVTGATGNVGRVLVQSLLKGGVKVRAIARNREKLLGLIAHGADERAGDIQDTAFLIEAFRGADAVFAMIPEHPNLPNFLEDKRKSAASLAQAIKTAGVSRVVALSAIGVNPPPGVGPAVPNREFEEMLKAIPGLSVIVLRAAFLMENHLGSLQVIKTAGINGSPARADVAFPMITTRDIAVAAVEYLSVPAFKGYAVRELLGPRDYTYREATSIFGAAIGKPDLAYMEFPFDDFRKGLQGAGFSPNTADAVVELYTAFNEGRIQRTVNRTPSNTTPTTLEEFAREVFAPIFRGS